MSAVRLNVVDAQAAIHGSVHGSIADAVVASLSAEPETILELNDALDRYIKHLGDYCVFDSFSPGEYFEPWDAGLVIIDLTARIVASDSTYSALGAEGEVQYHNGAQASDVWLPFRLPDDWLFLDSGAGLAGVEYSVHRDKRRTERAASPTIDARQVLYGSPMLEFIVWACSKGRPSDWVKVGVENEGSQSDANRPSIPDAQSSVDSGGAVQTDAASDSELRDAQSIHAQWLMTPRADLDNRTPREVILEKRKFIDFDLQTRELQWSMLGEGPPPLGRDTRAYRFGGFGTHEYVIYYDLFRYLLSECRKRVNSHTVVDAAPEILRERTAQPLEGSGPTSLVSRPTGQQSGKTHLQCIVEWLGELKETWLNAPNADFDGRVPNAIIACERRRLPLAISAKQMLFDENCDLCRLLAEETGEDFGPGFWHLDGCNMDQEFEFSSFGTRDEWEADQRQWEEFNEEFERQWARDHPDAESNPFAGETDAD